MSQTVPATCVLGPGKTGLAIGLRVLNLDGTTYSAFSTVGVAETSTLGTYRKASGAVVPKEGGYIIWGTAVTDYAEATVDSTSVNVTTLKGLTEPVDNLVLALGHSSGVMISNAAVDAVWDEAGSGHLTAGTMGAKLNAAAAGSGSGSTTYTDTVTDVSSNPLDGVEVWITSDSGGASTVASTTTNTLGAFTVYLDPGTYYLWLAKGGYNFPNPTTITVT